MAYTSPTTQTTGTLITASIWNTDIVDNIKETAPGKATAKGDIFAASAVNAIAKTSTPGNYWQPAWLSTNANGIAGAPNGCILKSANYALFENTSDVQTALTLTVPGGILTAGWLQLSSMFYIYNAKGTEGQVDVLNNYGSLACNGLHAGMTTSNYIKYDTTDGAARHTQYNDTWITPVTTTTQRSYFRRSYFHPNFANDGWGQGPDEAGTVDSTTDQTASITIQMDASSSSFQVEIGYCYAMFYSAGTLT